MWPQRHPTQVTITMLWDLLLEKRRKEKKKKRKKRKKKIDDSNVSNEHEHSIFMDSGIGIVTAFGISQMDGNMKRKWKDCEKGKSSNTFRMESESGEKERKKEWMKKKRSKLRRMKVFPNQITFVWKISVAQRTYERANFYGIKFIRTEIRME